MNKELKEEIRTKGKYLDNKTRKLILDTVNIRKKWNLLTEYEPDLTDKNHAKWEAYIGNPIDDELNNAETNLFKHLRKHGIEISPADLRTAVYVLSIPKPNDKDAKVILDKILNPYIERKAEKQPKMTNKKLTKMSRCR